MKKISTLLLSCGLFVCGTTLAMSQPAPAEIVLDATEISQALNNDALSSILKKIFSPEEFSDITTSVVTPDFFEADLEIAILEKDFPKFQVLVESARKKIEDQKMGGQPISEGDLTNYLFTKLNKDKAIKERFDNLVMFYDENGRLPTADEVTFLGKTKRAENGLTDSQETIVHSVVQNVSDSSIESALVKIENIFATYENSGMGEDQLEIIYGLVEGIREVAETVYADVEESENVDPSYDVCGVSYDGEEKYEDYLTAFYATDGGENCDVDLDAAPTVSPYTVCGVTYDGDAKYRQYLRAYKLTHGGEHCDEHDQEEVDSELYVICGMQYNGSDTYQDYLDKYKETRGGQYCDGNVPTSTDPSYEVCGVSYNGTDMYDDYIDAYYSTNAGEDCDAEITDQGSAYTVCGETYNGTDMYGEYLTAYRLTHGGQNCDGEDMGGDLPSWFHCGDEFFAYAEYLDAFYEQPVCPSDNNTDIVPCSYDEYLSGSCSYHDYVSCHYSSTCTPGGSTGGCHQDKGNGCTMSDGSTQGVVDCNGMCAASDCHPDATSACTMPDGTTQGEVDCNGMCVAGNVTDVCHDDYQNGCTMSDGSTQGVVDCNGMCVTSDCHADATSACTMPDGSTQGVVDCNGMCVTTPTCKPGETFISSSDGCLQDDAVCYNIGSGRCTGPTQCHEDKGTACTMLDGTTQGTVDCNGMCTTDSCPLAFACAAPPSGCYYDTSTIETNLAGCPSGCGDLVCNPNVPNMPENCTVRYDGCNTCTRDAGGISCTELQCVIQGEAYCMEGGGGYPGGTDGPNENEGQAECLASGGSRSMSLSGSYICYPGTPDAGNTCTDSTQCVDKCVVEGSSLSATTGTCGTFQGGCMSFIQNGEVLTICE